MQTNAVLHTAENRGHVQMGWLQSHHSFSFGEYYNPQMMGFGALRVINDDVIAAAKGFGTHPHKDMEIITIPTQGKVLHRDSLGTEGTIGVGEVQMMAAGTGILHSEINPLPDTDLKLFQIWILPREAGLKPGYQQMEYTSERGEVRWLVAPSLTHAGQQTLRINQDAFIGIVELGENNIKINTPIKGLGTYIFVIDGSIEVGEILLNSRDAFGHWSESVTIGGKSGSRALIFHVPVL